MQEKLSLWATCVSTLSMASFAGLAALLRSKQVLTWRNILSATMNSGVAGLVVGLTWYQLYDGQEHVLFMICISALAGLGGMSLLDFLVTCFQHGHGLNITISLKPGEKPDTPHTPTARKGHQDHAE